MKPLIFTINKPIENSEIMKLSQKLGREYLDQSDTIIILSENNVKLLDIEMQCKHCGKPIDKIEKTHCKYCGKSIFSKQSISINETGEKIMEEYEYNKTDVLSMLDTIFNRLTEIESNMETMSQCLLNKTNKIEKILKKKKMTLE